MQQSNIDRSRNGAAAAADSEASGSTTTASPPSPGAAGSSSTLAQPGESRPNARVGTKRKKWSAAERAEHSHIEKRRREEFNVSLLALARRLPAISHIKRTNKKTVVESAVEHVDAERRLVLDALPDLKALIAERDDLLRESNEWRLSAGLAQRQSSVDVATNLQKLNQVESYAFNAFASGFEGNDDDTAEKEERIQPTSSVHGQARPIKRLQASISGPSTLAPSTVSTSFNSFPSSASLPNTYIPTLDTGQVSAASLPSIAPMASPALPSTQLPSAPWDMAEFFRSPAFQQAAMAHFIASSSGQAHTTPPIVPQVPQVQPQLPPLSQPASVPPTQHTPPFFLPEHMLAASSPENQLSPMSAFLQAYTRSEQ